MPTKALIRSAEVMHLVSRGATEHGITIDGTVTFDVRRAVARKDAIVERIRQGIYTGLKGRREEISFVRGSGRFVNDHELEVDGRRISFANAIVATGAKGRVPAIPGLDAVPYLTNRTALELEKLPERLVVIGGGYVGIEFAQMIGRFGADVSLLGRNAQLAPGEDRELADTLAADLRDEGIDVRTSAAVTLVTYDGSQVSVTARVGDAEEVFVADSVLVATGRRANLEELDPEAAGLELGPEGFLAVDDQLTTRQPHIWAIGDVTGGWMFTHVATYEGPLAALNAVKGAGRTVDYRVVPRVVYSDPVLAAVGLTPEEARRRGRDVVVGSVRAVGARAMAMGSPEGRLKAVVDASSREILGFHILAPHGDDLLHEAVVAMHAGGTIDRITRSIHAHPTLSEMVKAAAKAAR